MKIGEFILYTLAVTIGVTLALAIAGEYAKTQISAATAGNTTFGRLLSLFSPVQPAATS